MLHVTLLHVLCEVLCLMKKNVKNAAAAMENFVKTSANVDQNVLVAANLKNQRKKNKLMVFDEKLPSFNYPAKNQTE